MDNDIVQTTTRSSANSLQCILFESYNEHRKDHKFQVNPNEHNAYFDTANAIWSQFEAIKKCSTHQLGLHHVDGAKSDVTSGTQILGIDALIKILKQRSILLSANEDVLYFMIYREVQVT